MKHHGLNQKKLARKSGVSQRTISTLLDTDNPKSINPRASTVDKLAKFFGVPAWQLFIPDIPLEVLASRTLGTLISNFVDASPDGRANISRIAEREMQYTVGGERPEGQQGLEQKAG